MNNPIDRHCNYQTNYPTKYRVAGNRLIQGCSNEQKHLNQDRRFKVSPLRVEPDPENQLQAKLHESSGGFSAGMAKLLQKLKIPVVILLLMSFLLTTRANSTQSIPISPDAAMNAALPQPKSQPLKASQFAQMQNIRNIRDVTPQDRYYEAVKSLVERHGVGLVLYECPFIDVKPANCKPVPLFRGKDPLLRRDFVMALNDGLNRLMEVIASPFGNPIPSKQDLEFVASQWQNTSRSLEQELTQIERRLTQLERKVGQS